MGETAKSATLWVASIDEDKGLKPLALMATSPLASAPSYCSGILLEHPIEPVVQHRED